MYQGNVTLSDNPQKKCSKCGGVFPATTEYFRKAKRGKYGLRSSCKVCDKEYMKQWQEENREQRIEYMKQWRLENPEYPKEWYRKNPNYSRQRYRDNPEQYSKYQNKYHKSNPKAKKQWYQKYKNSSGFREKHRVTLLRYRSRKNQLADTLTAEQWQVCLNYFDHKCAYCGRDIDLFSHLQADHFIPLSDDNCPGTTALNIVPACSSKDELLSCNQSKGANLPQDWLISRFGKSQAAKILARIEAYFDWIRTLDE